MAYILENFLATTFLSSSHFPSLVVIEYWHHGRPTSKVLLTGANGFVASHILSSLVKRNYHVVTTVRSEKKVQEILDLTPSWKPNITFIYVPNIIVPNAFNGAFADRGYDNISHNASPLNFQAKEIQSEIIDPAVAGTKGLIEYAHKHGGDNLKQSVLLGSAIAALNEFEDMNKAGNPYTEVTAEYIIENSNIVASYHAFKELAGQAAWQNRKKINHNSTSQSSIPTSL
ncbi:NAD(P)-binding protein [Zopfia rhizophila CBS 207.26]|uniref:NAD(P)-binding protein n=1 Tax=Zopfia rhizophila CBS 207.26 TaxID=1314779 RepID=A0A6A6DI78_9PEZI|nr:NAD(P)-binding protein [Zopfia rhizophila CBS 207.26]